MSLLAQHGYGKAAKIDRGLSTGDISGVILSPKAETFDKLAVFSAELCYKYVNKKIYFDPQFYICGIQGDVTAGKLPTYPYYMAGLTRANLSAPSNLRAYAQRVIEVQEELPVSGIFSPSIIFDDFDGRESQTVISLAYESISLTDAENMLYITLCINENAFRNRTAMEDFLNVISLLDVKGFYVIIDRSGNTGKPTEIDAQILSNIMWFLYTLSGINGFDVIVGYTDMLSIPLAAICNADFACGWYNNLKSFSTANFRPSSGGRRPRKRYTSGVLMNSLLLVPEIEYLKRQRIFSEIETPSPFNDIIRPAMRDAEWTDEVSCLHNWHVLRYLLKSIEDQGHFSTRIDFVSCLISEGIAAYHRIDREGIPLEPKSAGGHLNLWLEAIDIFRAQAGI